MISQEEIIRIKNLSAKVRGQTIINNFETFLLIEGKEGLEKLLSKLKELGCWVKEFENIPTNIKTFDWYPLWYDILPIVVAVDLFNWDKEKIRKFGIYNQKVSFFEKVLLKYFVSLKITAQTAGERWKKHYSEGELEVAELNEQKKIVRLVLKNFSPHPVLCNILEGYFEASVSYLVGSKLKVEETKCTFKGDPYHEFLITW